MTKSKTKRTAKRTSRRLHGVVSGRGYAWLCDFGLCHWVEPSKKVLRERSKPSPEAYEVLVRIITEKDWRRLIAPNSALSGADQKL